MELLDRYLQAIRWWLPSRAEHDLVTELADDLRSQIEEQENELGRKLQEDEVVAILRRCGHPMTVAGRLLPGKSFLDPALSVVYGFVLRIVLLGVFPAAFVLTMVPALLSGHGQIGVILGRIGSLAQAALFAFAIITLIFFLVDRHQSRLGITQEWDPRRLPRVRDTRRISRAGSAAELVVAALFLAWWNGVASRPFYLEQMGELRAWIDFFEAFRRSLYWPVTLLTAASMALSVVALFRPYWTRARLAIRTAIDGALTLVLALSLRPYRDELVSHYHRLAAGQLAASPPGGDPAVVRLVIICSVAATAFAVAIATTVGLVRLLTWRAGVGTEASRRDS